MARKPTILPGRRRSDRAGFVAAMLAALPAEVHVAPTCAAFPRSAGLLAADLYIIDLDLPDGDGLAVAEAVRHKSSTPIVY